MNNNTRKLRGGVRSQRKTQRRSIVQRFLKNQFQSRVKSLKPKHENTKPVKVLKEKVQKIKKERVNANNLLEHMKTVSDKLESLMGSYDNMVLRNSDSPLMVPISNIFVEISQGLVKLRKASKLSFVQVKKVSIYPTLALEDDGDEVEDNAIKRIDELIQYIEEVIIKKRNTVLGQLILDVFRKAFDKHKAELESAMEEVKARSGSNNESMHSNHGNEEMKGNSPNKNNNVRSSASNHRSRASSSEREEEELGDDIEDLMKALGDVKF